MAIKPPRKKEQICSQLDTVVSESSDGNSNEKSNVTEEGNSDGDDPDGEPEDPPHPTFRKGKRSQLLQAPAFLIAQPNPNNAKQHSTSHHTSTITSSKRLKKYSVETCRRLSGTKEWAAHNVNCCIGCLNNCLYCYARKIAERFKKVGSDEWSDPKINQKAVDMNRPLYKKGTVMFPTSHDIFPENLDACIVVLGKLFKAGNDVLIVSKPRLKCISALCKRFEKYKDKFLFRFTIGSTDDSILSVWEPGAPTYEERISSLKYAFKKGFQTSISAEPLLDAVNVETLVDQVSPFVTDSIWIGKMNHIGPKFINDNPGIIDAVMAVKAGQTDEKIKAIYSKLKSHPKVQWKDSIKKVIDLG